MADNFVTNSGDGAGDTFAADEITSVKHQRVKVQYGADGSATDVSDTNPMPIDDAGGTLTIDNSTLAVVGGGTEATAMRVTLASDSTGVITIDGTVAISSGTITTVSTVTNLAQMGGVAISLNTGVRDTGTQRVSIATDDTLPVTNAGTFAVQADSVIPGTGATNLGKAIDSVVGSTDTGVAVLCKHLEDHVHTTTADGDYEIAAVDSLGALVVNGEQHHTFDSMNATTGWTVLGNDTTNLATTTIHAMGTAALTFDKADGAANTVFSAIQKTLSSVDLGSTSPHDILQTVCYTSDTTNISYAFVRLGTDSSNYSEWRIDGTALTSGEMETLAFSLGDTSHGGSTGTGWDPSAVTYVCIGMAFATETDTLTGIIFDEISYHTNQHTSASIQSEVTSSVSSSNVNLQKVGGTATAKGSGNLTNGTQRVAIATDDVNMSSIATLVQAQDSAVGGTAAGIAILAQRDDEQAAVTPVDGDYVVPRCDKFGNLKVTQLPDATSAVQYAIIDAASSGDNTLQAAAGAGIKIRVLSAFLVSAGTVTARFESGASGTALTGQMNLVANSGFTLPYNPAGWFETADNALLNLELSAGISVDGCISYVEV
jgi:hypothetical protein